MSSSRVHRLLQLIVLLQGGRARTAYELADELGVSRRTVFRDLNMLQEAGIPCFHDPAKGHQISQSFFLPPISLTVPETLALMLLGKTMDKQRGRPLTGSTLAAINKLTATVPQPIRAACDDMMSHVSIDPGAQDRGANESHYLTLQRCIDERRTCRFVYGSPTEAQPLEGRLEPYALHFATRAWYVLGRTDIHDEVRLLKLARFQELEPTPQLFKRPRGFTVEDKLSKAWSLIPEGKIHKVELEFTAKVGQNVAEVRWHATQQHELLPDGRCRMSFEVDGLSEISWWLCGYADQVTVHKPAALRRRLTEMHRSAAERHDDVEDNVEPPRSRARATTDGVTKR